MRFGFSYFPDTLHYSQNDLAAWLPELSALGATWLRLEAPIDRAIPEFFIQGLLKANIRPILHFQCSPEQQPSPTEMRVLFETYARWGVREVCLFDRPNSRRVWNASHWAQQNLVERFLDMYLPLAEVCLSAGLTPIFPPLEPGGDYWDTAFLRDALEALQRRNPRLLEHLWVGAYGWADEHPLNWGAGGPERWPETRPYLSTPNSQDQRGFRIFDWYLAISRAVLGTSLPIILMGMGHRFPNQKTMVHTQTNLSIARLLNQEEVEGQEPVPPEVLAGCFWLLSANSDSPQAASAWFQTDTGSIPTAGALRQYAGTQSPSSHSKNIPSGAASLGMANTHPIHHYLLLPTYEWGVADWHLEVIRPYVKKHRPTIGFSIQEAQHAAKVTVIGGVQTISEEAIHSLQQSGCQVERISGDGTEIATQLANQ